MCSPKQLVNNVFLPGFTPVLLPTVQCSSECQKTFEELMAKSSTAAAICVLS